MALITWDDSLDLHIDMINEEHKILIDFMNKLHQQNKDGESKETKSATLLELSNYAAKHFSDEEEYMASINYHDLDAHKAIHQRLLSRINDFSNEYNAGDGTIAEDFFVFLKIWVTAHIKGIDIKYTNAE